MLARKTCQFKVGLVRIVTDRSYTCPSLAVYESTVRYMGIELDYALDMAEQTEIRPAQSRALPYESR